MGKTIQKIAKGKGERAEQAREMIGLDGEKLYTIKLTKDEIDTVRSAFDCEIDLMRDVLRDTDDPETEKETKDYIRSMKSIIELLRFVDRK